MILSLLVYLLIQTQDTDNQKEPIQVRPHTLFQTDSVTLIPDLPTTIEKDLYQFHIEHTISNNFSVDEKYNKYFFDFESERIDLNFSYCPTDYCRVGINVPFEDLTTGITDQTISRFHELFNFKATRNHYSNNQFHIATGDHYIQSGTYLDNILLYTQFKLWEQGEWYPAGIYGLQLSLPTSTLYHSTTGVGVSLNLRYEIESWTFNIGVVDFLTGKTEILDQSLDPNQSIYVISIEKQILSRCSLFTELITQSPSVHNFAPFTSWSFYAALGVKVRISHELDFECAAIENVIKYDNSTDFAMSIGLTYRLPK